LYSLLLPIWSIVYSIYVYKYNYTSSAATADDTRLGGRSVGRCRRNHVTAAYSNYAYGSAKRLETVDRRGRRFGRGPIDRGTDVCALAAIGGGRILSPTGTRARVCVIVCVCVCVCVYQPVGLVVACCCCCLCLRFATPGFCISLRFHLPLLLFYIVIIIL